MPVAGIAVGHPGQKIGNMPDSRRLLVGQRRSPVPGHQLRLLAIGGDQIADHHLALFCCRHLPGVMVEIFVHEALQSAFLFRHDV